MPDDLFFAIVKMVVALAFILGLAYGVVYLMKRLLPGATRTGMERVGLSLVTQLSLGSRQKICVVRVQDRTLILGVTEGSIHTLAELSAAKPDARKDVDDPRIFTDLLSWDKDAGAVPEERDGSPARRSAAPARPQVQHRESPRPRRGTDEEDDGPPLFPPPRQTRL